MTLVLAGIAPAPTALTLVGQPSQPPQPEDPGGQGPDAAKAAPTGLVVLLLFFVAVALLVRSMNKHLRRIPESFDQPDKPEPVQRPDATDKPDEVPRN